MQYAKQNIVFQTQIRFFLYPNQTIKSKQANVPGDRKKALKTTINRCHFQQEQNTPLTTTPGVAISML